MTTTHETRRLTITLRSGESFSFVVDRRPRHWKSWLMAQVPYGTSCQGATFTVDREGAR